jgi:hypothetical protein
MRNKEQAPTMKSPSRYKRSKRLPDSSTVAEPSAAVKPLPSVMNAPMRPVDDAVLARASISDCLSGLLPDLGGKLEEMRVVKHQNPKVKKQGVRVVKDEDRAFDKPVWQSQPEKAVKQQVPVEEVVPAADNVSILSPRGDEPSPRPQPVEQYSPSPRAPAQAPLDVKYNNGSSGVTRGQDGTSVCKWPKGSDAVVRGPDYITATYGTGKIAVMFDRYGNGNIMDPSGKTVVSISPKKFLMFVDKKKGRGQDIMELDGNSGEKRVQLSQELAVAFTPAPLRIVVFFKCKNLHCKFMAPGLFQGGSSVEMLSGREDLFGDKEKVKKEKAEKDVYESNDDFLSAIQRAVAGLG